MVHSFSNSMTITSFISNLTHNSHDHFPEHQIQIYCQKNTIALDKIQNVLKSYMQKFKRTYENFKQTVVLLYIALKIIQHNKMSTRNSLYQNIIKKSLHFIEDLITSKMFLVCVYTKQKIKNAIYGNFVYLENLLKLLIPRLLQDNQESQIIDLLQKVNNQKNVHCFSSVNFLVEFMFIISVYCHLSEDSSRKFKQYILSMSEGKKKVIMQGFWQNNISNKRQLNFSELMYFRTNVQSAKTNNFILQNDKVTYYPTNNNPVMQGWIIDGYQKDPTTINFNNASSCKTVLDIYQFLFKLQVFASSPKIEELDIIIPNQDFLQLFSKFLMGQSLSKEKRINSVEEILNSFGSFNNFIKNLQNPYKTILQRQLMKIAQSDKQDSISQQMVQKNK